MSSQRISAALRAAVRKRARGCCEYCLVHEDDVLFPHEPDHITADQHGGRTTLENLALACFHCNRYKGPNLSSIDAGTGKIASLFNPRADDWSEHFRVDGARIIPLSATGRATAALLRLNDAERLRLRESLRLVGRFPYVE